MATTMTTSTTSSVYIHVIEDVINKIRDEFVDNGGPGEDVLSELQGIWEMKMMQAGGILGPIDRSAVPRPMHVSGITPVHDLNVPYLGTEEYETPTADILFPPTPLQTPMQTPLPGSVQTPLHGSVQTPLPGTVDNSPYNIPTGSSDYSPLSYTGGAPEMKVGRPSMYMPPPSPWMNQRPPLSVDVNVAYEEGREEVDRGTSNQQSTQDFLMPPGKRKRGEFDSQYQNGGYLPQQDGAGDARFEVFQGNQESSSAGERDRDFSIQIPQLDGPIPNPYDGPIPNPYDGPIQNHYDDAHSTQNMYNYQGVVNEDYNIVNTPAPNDMPLGTPAVAFQNDVDDDDDEPPLNEDDDDDLDDVDQGEDLNTQHLVLAQFDKVTRTKSRWKCTLKDGIMHINNRDILFNKANGEFEF